MTSELTAEALAEEQLLAGAEDLLEKSASAPGKDEFLDDEDDRFESRVVVQSAAADEEEAEAEEEARTAEWGPQPTVRDQFLRHPDSVRLADPETKVLNLSDKAQLDEFNRIQRASSDPEKPTLSIVELEKQPFQGSWTVLVTFSKVQYRRL
jgi:hypothetical protein